MSYNGSGVYTLPGAQLANGATVSATENNQFRNDVATALNVAWTRDGQAPATNDIPMGSNKLTELAQPTTEGDALAFGKNATVDDLAVTGNSDVTGDETVGGNLTVTGTASLGGQYFTPYTGFKNRIINGAFIVNQRAVSGTVTLAAGVYGHDRWKAGASGCTYTFATSSGLTTITITSGSLQQIIENVNVPDGTNTMVMSWTGTAQGKIGAGSYGASGVTGSVTGGSNLTVEFNTGTLTKVQLEKGSTATSFDYRPYGAEFALCQRYYHVNSGTYGAYHDAIGSLTYFSLPYATQMRATPTISLSASGGGGYSSVTPYAIGDNHTSIQVTASSAPGILAFNFAYTASAEL